MGVVAKFATTPFVYLYQIQFDTTWLWGCLRKQISIKKYRAIGFYK